jgi:hypothetical protein
MKITEANWEKKVPTITLCEEMVLDTSGKYVLKPTTVKPYMFWRDDALYLSAEEGDGLADYWEMFIHPELEAWADAKGYYWEWENAGCLVLGKL